MHERAAELQSRSPRLTRLRRRRRPPARPHAHALLPTLAPADFGTDLDQRTVIHAWLSSAALIDCTSKGYRAIWSVDGLYYLDALGETWTSFYDVDILSGITNTSASEEPRAQSRTRANAQAHARKRTRSIARAQMHARKRTR